MARKGRIKQNSGHSGLCVWEALPFPSWCQSLYFSQMVTLAHLRCRESFLLPGWPLPEWASQGGVSSSASIWLRLANVIPLLGGKICLMAPGKVLLIDKKIDTGWEKSLLFISYHCVSCKYFLNISTLVLFFFCELFIIWASVWILWALRLKIMSITHVI